MAADARAAVAQALQSLNIRAEFLPVVAAISPGMTNKFFSGPFDDASLRQWVELNKLPLVATLSPLNFEDVMNSGRRAVLLVTDDQYRLADGYVDAFLPLAAKYSRHFTFAAMDGTKFAGYLQQFGVLREHLPTMLAMDYPNDLFFVDDSLLEIGHGIYDTEGQTAFLEGLLSGAIKAKATTKWYSLARYKRILERWAADMTETQLIFVVLGLMAIVTAVMLGSCYFLLTQEEKASADAEKIKAEEQRLAALKAQRARVQSAVGRVQTQRSDRTAAAAAAAEAVAAVAEAKKALGAQAPAAAAAPEEADSSGSDSEEGEEGPVRERAAAAAATQ